MSTTTRATPVISGLHVREALLVCGVLSSLVYVANNVVCSLVWKDYSSFSQTISELSARNRSPTDDVVGDEDDGPLPLQFE